MDGIRHARFRLSRSHRFALLTLFLLGLLQGCSSFGPDRIAPDRFDYTEAISRSTKEQMLMNLVRMRFADVPVFLEVSSVLTQYAYVGDVGVTGTAGLNGATGLGSSVGGDARIAYFERPTVTFSPLSGEEFTRRLLEPISAEQMLSVRRAGWPAGLLWSMSIQRVNNVHNVGFGPVPPLTKQARIDQAQRDREAYERFRHLIHLSAELRRLGAIEIERGKTADDSHLVIATDVAPNIEPLVREYREILDLDPKINRFQFVEDKTGQAADEITVEGRSLIGIMYFLSRGIDVPVEDEQATSATLVSMDAKGDSLTQPIPLRVRSQPARPGIGPPPEAFVAVKYRGAWFFIADEDVRSKLAFGLLRYLFQLKAPATDQRAPLITVPIG